MRKSRSIKELNSSSIFWYAVLILNVVEHYEQRIEILHERPFEGWLKGQLISKCLWCLQFLLKKERKQVDLRYHTSKVEFVCLPVFCLKKSFRLFWPVTGHGPPNLIGRNLPIGQIGHALLGQPSKGHPYRILILFP